jgi:hypothetical protein
MRAVIDVDSGIVEASAHVRSGSTASVEQSWHVGFTPDSGRVAVTQRTDASGHYRKSGGRSTQHMTRVRRGSQSKLANFSEPVVDIGACASERIMRRPMPTAERTMIPGASDQDEQTKKRLDRGDAIRERLLVGQENLYAAGLSCLRGAKRVGSQCRDPLHELPIGIE